MTVTQGAARGLVDHPGVSMELPPKQDVARALLLSGSMFIHLDPRVEGVMVPKWLKRQPQLVLQLGLDMAIPIPDLRVDEHGVYGTLSFNRAPFTVVVPWDAVFALWGDDGMGMVWAEDMPPEIAAEVEQAVKRGEEPEEPERLPVRRDKKVAAAKKRDAPAPHRLRAIEGGASESSARSTESAEASAEGERRLPPYLRVIK